MAYPGQVPMQQPGQPMAYPGQVPMQQPGQPMAYPGQVPMQQPGQPMAYPGQPVASVQQVAPSPDDDVLGFSSAPGSHDEKYNTQYITSHMRHDRSLQQWLIIIGIIAVVGAIAAVALLSQRSELPTVPKGPAATTAPVAAPAADSTDKVEAEAGKPATDDKPAAAPTPAN
jgi:hypothetical protein